MLIRIAQDGDFITGDRIFDYSNSLEDVKYFKIDFLFKSGMWRGREFSIKDKNDFAKKSVVIGHSDIKFGYKAWLVFKLLGVRNVIALNMGVSKTRHYALPLGIPEWILGRQDEPIINNIIFETFNEVSSEQLNIYNIYSNFSYQTFPLVRLPLYKLIQKMPEVRMGNLDSSQTGKTKYLNEIRKSNMVLCPRGNGIDTFRFWETLYLGAVPVVVEEDLPKGILDFDFPLILLRNWDEITDARLIQRKYEESKSISHNIDNLSFSFLKDYINQIIVS